ncbi:MAG TPA: hypothetical protein VE030_11070 [Burkholderiales bacterium]|nr:hypothetical protein [Burkholderiales bacterium]
MTDRLIWAELFPGQPWPGEEAVLRALAAEVRTLRSTIVNEPQLRRTLDEIQRAHDLVGQYCYETQDEATFQFVSALCWVLGHDHNPAFADTLATIETLLEGLGVQVVRLPHLVYPTRGESVK